MECVVVSVEVGGWSGSMAACSSPHSLSLHPIEWAAQCLGYCPI